MNFKEILIHAQEEENIAIMTLLDMYKPLLIKSAIINGKFNEDLYQELCIVFLKCIYMFRI